jgi:hypothetical protein
VDGHRKEGHLGLLAFVGEMAEGRDHLPSDRVVLLAQIDAEHVGRIGQRQSYRLFFGLGQAF